MKKSVSLLIAVFTSLLLFFGCATLTTKSDNHISVNSNVPSGCHLEYSGQIDGVTFFVIYSLDADDFEHFYDNWIAKIGPNNKLQEVKVRNVERFRDGGTTIVETAMGIFYFPTPFSQDRCPTLNDKIIEVYDRPDWSRCKRVN
jgi:hypothetical protein